MSTRPFRKAQNRIGREKFYFPADFGSVREGLGTYSGHLKAVTGRSGRAQAGLEHRERAAA